MFIQEIEKSVFEAVMTKMFQSASYPKIDVNYYPCVQGMSTQDITDTAETWYELHILSYTFYKKLPAFQNDIILNTHPVIVSTVQLLKWIETIHNNINMDCLKGVRDISYGYLNAVDFLDTLIFETRTMIIHHLPEYREAPSYIRWQHLLVINRF